MVVMGKREFWFCRFRKMLVLNIYMYFFIGEDCEEYLVLFVKLYSVINIYVIKLSLCFG